MEAAARSWYMQVMEALTAALQAATPGERHPAAIWNRNTARPEASNSRSPTGAPSDQGGVAARRSNALQRHNAEQTKA
jgi:hypothetical protein